MASAECPASTGIGKIPAMSTAANSLLSIITGGTPIGTSSPLAFAWCTHFGTTINLAGHRLFDPFIPRDDQQCDHAATMLYDLDLTAWANGNNPFLSLTPGMHLILGHTQAPPLTEDGELRPNLAIAFQDLLINHTLDAYSNQAHTGICYKKLLEEPVNFLTILKLYAASSEAMQHYFLTILCCPGMTKFGIPWNPDWDTEEDGTQFPLIQLGANIRAAKDGDIEDLQPLVNGGFCPITATISSAFDGNIQALNSVHDTSPSSGDIVTLCDMIVCFWGPTWGTSTPHAGAPLVQSMVILDRAPNEEITDLLKPLSCNPEDQDDLAEVNKEASYIVFCDEDGELQEFNQIILTIRVVHTPASGI